MALSICREYGVSDLIDTLWNVKAAGIFRACTLRPDLIDTLWNVKKAIM